MILCFILGSLVIFGVTFFTPSLVAGPKEVRVVANLWMQQGTPPVLTTMLCSASLDELPALFRMLMGAILTLDSSRAPVVKKQFADWSCVIWISR